MSIDLSLRRIEALVSQFETYRRPTVHIAGTNGKGSVSALLTSIFRRAGLSVGRFNSPHLLHPSDSISLDGKFIPHDIFSNTVQDIQKKDEEHAINASSFELLTMCALLVFERSKVDIVLLEVGMGGRLDATNVIPDECILVSVITAIDLDHQAFLGPTIEDIAREKAGIIRNGKPVVLAPQIHGCIKDVVTNVCKKKNSPLVLACVAKERRWDEGIDGERMPSFSLHPFIPPPPRPVDIETPPSSREDGFGHDSVSNFEKPEKFRVLLPLHGPHQLGNLGAALMVLHVLRSWAFSGPLSYVSAQAPVPSTSAPVYERVSRMDEADIHAAIRHCTWPGRLSFHLYRDPPLNMDVTATTADGFPTLRKCPVVVLVDGAHNEAAARALSEYVSSLLFSLGVSDRRKKRRISLTIILALSHSPPKTPASVLVPLLAPFLETSKPVSAFPKSEIYRYREYVQLTTRIGLLRFSLPDRMPWVRPVPPSVAHEVICNSFSEINDSDFWIASDTGRERGTLQDLKDALRWATGDRPAMKDQDAEERCEEDEENLVLVAGSLYLVADFYRLLQLHGQGSQTESV
ncbi:FOL3 [Sanghuangporus sanghuang]